MKFEPGPFLYSRDEPASDANDKIVVCPLFSVLEPCGQQKRAMNIFPARIRKMWSVPVFLVESR
jgi:hypothetical protein